jgi:hypothetical protein
MKRHRNFYMTKVIIVKLSSAAELSQPTCITNVVIRTRQLSVSLCCYLRPCRESKLATVFNLRLATNVDTSLYRYHHGIFSIFTTILVHNICIPSLTEEIRLFISFEMYNKLITQSPNHNSLCSEIFYKIVTNNF